MQNYRDKIFYAICFLFVFIILFSDFYIKDPPEVFERQVGQKLDFVGQIVEEPDIRENNQKLTVEIKDPTSPRLRGASIKVLITTDFSNDFEYGEWIKWQGKLEKPENFITDTGKEFDYINYLKKDGIMYLSGYPEISQQEGSNLDKGNFVKGALISVKQKFLEKINFAISEPESLLMAGLILGERAAFTTEQRQEFIDTGTIHIVALSGYNITIVAEWIMKLFAFLPLISSIAVGIVAIFLFILMTGGASTAVRAGIMATLALVARATGRNYDVGRALVLAGVVMILFNPMILRYDVSFQLSFIATVAVIFLAPKFEKYFLWVTPKFGLRDIVSVTVSAYIFVLPFILYKMGNLSLVALPANILVLPFIPFTMFLGFLTGFVGLFSYFLSVPIGYLSYLLLYFELGVIHLFSSFPFASFTIPNFPLVLTLAIYAYFVYKLFGKNIKKFFEI